MKCLTSGMGECELLLKLGLALPNLTFYDVIAFGDGVSFLFD